MREGGSVRFSLACALAAVAALSGAPAPASSHAKQCGTTRWPVKTLSDPAAKSLPSKAVPTTIDTLLRETPPAAPDLLPDRMPPIETTLWSVRARLLAYWVERDSDYHLVLADLNSGKTLYGEIPSPDCVQTHKNVYAAERAYVDKLGRRPASATYWWLNRKGRTPPVVTVAGYGFFDHVKAHPDPGQAPNGIEIHPVLEISR